MSYKNDNNTEHLVEQFQVFSARDFSEIQLNFMDFAFCMIFCHTPKPMLK